MQVNNALDAGWDQSTRSSRIERCALLRHVPLLGAVRARRSKSYFSSNVEFGSGSAGRSGVWVEDPTEPRLGRRIWLGNYEEGCFKRSSPRDLKPGSWSGTSEHINRLSFPIAAAARGDRETWSDSLLEAAQRTLLGSGNTSKRALSMKQIR